MSIRCTFAAATVLVAVACRSSTSPGTRTATAPGEAAPLVIPPLGPDAGAPASEPTVSVGPVEVVPTVMIAARDPRIADRRPRSRAAVLGEAQALERQLARTPRTAPDRADLLRRQAEAWSQLALTSSGPDAARAWTESIKPYVELATEHPTYPQHDEVHYYLGLAYELTGDLRNARKAYLEVVVKDPSSKLVPLAYFAFGEMFFAEGAGDTTKNDLADQAFQKVVSYGATSGVMPDALLRIGEIHLRKKEEDRARHTFDRLRQLFPSSAAAQQVPDVP